MAEWFPFCPQPPSWQVDWDAIDDAYPWVRALRVCPQDPVHHAEGDVWIHTHLVCAALAELAGFRGASPDDRQLLFVAALLHDVAKPDCTRVDGDGRITSPGHSHRGAIQARQILWQLGAPFAARESVCSILRFHQVPFFLIERPDAQRLAIEISLGTRYDHLALVAKADARGRVCTDQSRLLENIALSVEYCRELACLDRPYPFPSDHSRFLYFRRPDRDPTYFAHDDTRSRVTVLSGLPGAGKDRWIAQNVPDLPIVSLDRIRAELGVAPTDPQGTVIHRAQELAKSYLRRGDDFVWNGTNLSRQVRARVIDVLADYHARVEIVYVEAPVDRLWDQNRARAHPVPTDVIEHLLDRWEVPDLTEGHALRCITDS